MKVAMIDPGAFSPYYNHELCDALVKEEVAVVLITSKNPNRPFDLRESYPCYHLFYKMCAREGVLTNTWLRKYLKGFEHIFNMNKLISFLTYFHPDVIHFQWIPLPLIDYYFLPKMAKIAPLVLTVHNTTPFHGHPSSSLQILNLQKVMKCFDHLIVHTQYSKRVLTFQSNIPAERISIIPHGILRLDRGSSEYKVPAGDKKVILHFGLLRPYKGLDLLIKAFAELPEKVKQEAMLIIAGRPLMDVRPLINLAEMLGISAQINWILRYLAESEVVSLFRRAEFVVLPYRNIDQSGVLMTAIAFGKPVIVTRIGGFPEIIKNGTHGFVVDPGDVDGLSQAMTELLVNSRIRNEMSKNVQLLGATELSWNAIAQRTKSLYQRLILRHNGRN